MFLLHMWVFYHIGTEKKADLFIKLVYAKKRFNTFLQIVSFINDSFWILIFVHKMMWNSKNK